MDLKDKLENALIPGGFEIFTKEKHVSFVFMCLDDIIPVIKGVLKVDEDFKITLTVRSVIVTR